MMKSCVFSNTSLTHEPLSTALSSFGEFRRRKLITYSRMNVNFKNSWLAFSFLGALLVTGCRSRAPVAEGPTPHREHPRNCTLPTTQVTSVGKFSERLIAAVSAGNRKQIEGLTACELEIGPPRSEVEGFAERKPVIEKLLKRLRGYRWKEDGVTADRRYFLGSLPPSPYVELVFEKGEDDAWLWVGVASADEKLRRSLLR